MIEATRYAAVTICIAFASGAVCAHSPQSSADTSANRDESMAATQTYGMDIVSSTMPLNKPADAGAGLSGSPQSYDDVYQSQTMSATLRPYRVPAPRTVYAPTVGERARAGSGMRPEAAVAEPAENARRTGRAQS